MLAVNELLFPSKGLLLGWIALVATAMEANAVYVLLKGRLGPPIGRQTRRRGTLPRASRLALALLYFAFGTALLILVGRLAIAECLAI